MHIFFYEAFLEEEEALMRHLPKDIQAGFTWKSIQESGHELPPASLISTRTQSIIPPAWAAHLRGILTRSTGYDHLVSFLTGEGKKVQAGYLPHYCSRAVAEQALLLWLGLLRKIRVQMSHLKRFDRDNLTGMECLGKTLLVVGVGNIGFEICRIGEALGMQVFGVDIVQRNKGIRYVPIHEAIGRADIICCAMNLTPENAGYFTYDLMKNVRPGAVFVNIARGEFARASDLLRLLDEDRLGGVGLDVYENEGGLAASLRAGADVSGPAIQEILALMNHEKTILTPHNSFNTRESVERKASQSMEQAIHFLKKGGFIWDVREKIS